MTARWRDPRGVAATIVLFPIFVAVTFMFVQGVYWQLDRQVAAAAADRASEAVAMYGSSAGAAEAVAVAQMESAGIRDVSVSVSRGSDLTTVTRVGHVARDHRRHVGPRERPVGDAERGSAGAMTRPCAS